MTIKELQYSISPYGIAIYHTYHNLWNWNLLGKKRRMNNNPTLNIIIGTILLIGAIWMVNYALFIGFLDIHDPPRLVVGCSVLSVILLLFMGLSISHSEEKKAEKYKAAYLKRVEEIKQTDQYKKELKAALEAQLEELNKELNTEEKDD